MSIGFFIVGGCIFATYMYLAIWNIVAGNKKQERDNYPNSTHYHKEKENKL
jgi:hypothetical protein